MSAEEDTSYSCKTACNDDDEAEKNVGFEVLLHIAEELGTCDKTYSRYKEDKSELFNDAECLLDELYRFSLTFNDKLIGKGLKEQCTKQKCNEEHPSVAERDSLNSDSTDTVTYEQYCKDAEDKKMQIE